MSFRQTCRVCGRPDKFNFYVPDGIWEQVVPRPLRGVVCLFCFDALAEMRGVEYADHIDEIWFAGDKATLKLQPESRLSP